jgi:hypothetical protein
MVEDGILKRYSSLYEAKCYGKFSVYVECSCERKVGDVGIMTTKNI